MDVYYEQKKHVFGWDLDDYPDGDDTEAEWEIDEDEDEYDDEEWERELD